MYVRERQAISLRDALAKTSLIPARILEGSVPQMRRKGRIAPDMDADLVVFDLATIADRATYEKPAQTSAGIRRPPERVARLSVEIACDSVRRVRSATVHRRCATVVVVREDRAD